MEPWNPACLPWEGMGVSKPLGMMGTMGKNEGRGGEVVKVSHKYSWRFGTYK